MEEDLFGIAAVVMMPLDQTVVYTTHRPGPLAAKISAGPVIDVSAQPCAPEDCPLGPFVHEEEELWRPKPQASFLSLPHNRAANTFKKRLTENITTLTVGVV